MVIYWLWESSSLSWSLQDAVNWVTYFSLFSQTHKVVYGEDIKHSTNITTNFLAIMGNDTIIYVSIMLPTQVSGMRYSSSNCGKAVACLRSMKSGNPVFDLENALSKLLIPYTVYLTKVKHPPHKNIWILLGLTKRKRRLTQSLLASCGQPDILGSHKKGKAPLSCS